MTRYGDWQVAVDGADLAGMRTRSQPMTRRRFCGASAQTLAGMVLAGTWSGCRQRGANAEGLTVYTALDREFSEPLLEQFAERTGIPVRMTFDVESTKTVGLTQRLLAEAARPRCDLFWNNEILHTLRLEQAGMLRPLTIPEVDRYPSQYRSPTGHWFGFAARARVLIVNHQRVAEEQFPRELEDLLQPQWADRFAVAKPLFGTTATHAACLFAKWGTERAERFWGELLTRGQVLSGNKRVAEAVGAGHLDCGLTDTDDALAEVAAGNPVTLVYPDQAEQALGTLFIPNTLAALAGRPESGQVERLVEFLLSREVETILAEGPSGQIPLQSGLSDVARVETPARVRAMEVDFQEVAAAWDVAAERLAALLAGR